MALPCLQSIEKAKCEPAENEAATIGFTEGDLSIRERIEKDEFERINDENFRKIETCIDEVVAQSGMTPAQIDTASLTGGTSRIPYIQKLFAERFGREKSENRNAFTSAAHGLGSSAPLFV